MRKQHIALIAGAGLVVAGAIGWTVYASQPETHTCVEWLEVKGYDPEETEGLVCSLSDKPENQQLTEDEFNAQVADMTDMVGEWADQLEDL